ncbi:MAG: DUF2695 domain-containing protein [Pseudonocardia sediminis]
MSIDDIRRPTPFSVDHWRAVLHDAVDQVLDEILDAAENEWSDRLDDDHGLGHGIDDDDLDDDLFDDDPPGDPPSAAEITAAGASLQESLATAIVDGTRVWGCDGTLRCTGEWAERYRLPADRVLGEYRRAGITCDCAVLHTVLGRTDVDLRCPVR